MNESPTPLNTSEPQIIPKKAQTSLPLPSWRLWLPLFLQTLLILVVPTQKLYTYNTGKLVTLQTVPVDPYDVMRGYSQTLSYDISNPERLKKLPGGLNLQSMSKFYLILEAPTEVNQQPPKPWKPVLVSSKRPEEIAANQVILMGKYQGRRIVYGLETYYLPEAQGEQINSTIREIQAGKQQAFVVEVKVDTDGNAVPVSLWLRDHRYRF